MFLHVYLFTGFGDLEFSIYAYISALASVVCQSFYLTYIQKSGVEEGLSTVTVLFTNSVNCVPLLFIYTLCNNELFSAFAFDGLNIAGFQVCLLCCHIEKYNFRSELFKMWFWRKSPIGDQRIKREA